MPISPNNLNTNKFSTGTYAKKGSRRFVFTIDKRQKFVIGTFLLSLGLFFSEFQFGRSGIFIPIILSIFTCLFLYWALHKDLKDTYTLETFILPFFYSLAFGMFYFVTPTNLSFRLLLTAIYAFG